MSADCYEVPNSNNSSINIIILSSGSSLIDILNQQSCPSTDKVNSTPMTLMEDTKSHSRQTQDSESNNKIHESSNFQEDDKLSTLFNPTGRERNSTGPLKEWLYKHQDHPCR
jgi:hypothetical protein